MISDRLTVKVNCILDAQVNVEFVLILSSFNCVNSVKKFQKNYVSPYSCPANWNYRVALLLITKNLLITIL